MNKHKLFYQILKIFLCFLLNVAPCLLHLYINLISTSSSCRSVAVFLYPCMTIFFSIRKEVLREKRKRKFQREYSDNNLFSFLLRKKEKETCFTLNQRVLDGMNQIFPRPLHILCTYIYI